MPVFTCLSCVELMLAKEAISIISDACMIQKPRKTSITYKAENGVVCQASEQAKDSVGRSDFLLFVQSQTHNNTKMSKLKLL